MPSTRFNEETITLEILSGLAQIVVHEQCFVFLSLGQSSTCKIHMFQILKTMLCSCNELAQSLRALFIFPNENNWSTNTCGINKQRTCITSSCITSSSNIQDQKAQYIYLNG